MVCKECGGEFILQPNKPGFANVCPTCTESPEAHARKAEQTAMRDTRKRAASRINERNRIREERHKQKLEAMGYKVIRRFVARPPIKDEN